METKMCAMCTEFKTLDKFRFMKHQNRYNAYCKECEKFYHRNYMRKYNKKEVK